MALTSENIYGLYREHAQVETIIGELKSGFGAVKSHCQKFDMNQSLTRLCDIAYNIKTLYASQILKYDDRRLLLPSPPFRRRAGDEVK